jgi:hypothetical protein
LSAANATRDFGADCSGDESALPSISWAVIGFGIFQVKTPACAGVEEH